MQNSLISFTSTLRPTTLANFTKEISSIPSKNNITTWDLNHIVKSEDAYTRQTSDCTVCGITDGKEVVLAHICPSFEENADFSEIERKITEKIDMKSPNLQGFLLGSWIVFPESEKLFQNFQNFMKKNNIVYSMFKGHNMISNNTAVAYKSVKDEWIFTNNFIDTNIKKNVPQKEFLSNAFDSFVISDKDELVV